MSVLLGPFLVLSAVGLILSLILHAFSLFNVTIVSGGLGEALFVWAFAVMSYTLLTGCRYVRDYGLWDLSGQWKVKTNLVKSIWATCPKWMIFTAVVLFPYEVISPIVLTEPYDTPTASGTPLSVLRFASGTCMACCSYSLLLLCYEAKAKQSRRA